MFNRSNCDRKSQLSGVLTEQLSLRDMGCLRLYMGQEKKKRTRIEQEQNKNRTRIEQEQNKNRTRIEHE